GPRSSCSVRGPMCSRRSRSRYRAGTIPRRRSTKRCTASGAGTASVRRRPSAAAGSFRSRPGRPRPDSQKRIAAMEIDMDNREGRPVAWVTGGATGIGRACARELGKAGYTVVVSGRREALLAEARADLAADEIDVHPLAVDVADAAAVAAAVGRILDDFGRLDLLVCSAGINAPNRYWRDLTPEAFARVSAVNLNGVAFCVAS